MQVRAAYLQELNSEEGNIGRPGTVDEVARVVDFFAGPLGSFVSGYVATLPAAGITVL